MNSIINCIEEKFDNLKINENYIKNIEKDIASMSNKEAKVILKKLIDFTKENNLKYAYSWTLFNLAKAYNEEDKYDCSDILFSEAFEIFSENKDIEGILSSTAGLTSCKFMKGEYKKAIEFCLNGIKLAEENNKISRLIVLKGSIAKIYMEIEEYKKAIEVLEEINNIPWIGNTFNQLVLNINRVTCEIEQSNIEKALDILIEIKELAKSIPTFNIKWHVEMSKIHIYNKEYDKAEKNIFEAINLYKKFEVYDLKDEVLLTLNTIYLEKKQYTKAIEGLKSIEDTVIKSNVLRFIKEVYYKLNIAYKEVDDYKNAYCYFEKYINIKESIRKIQLDTSVNMLNNKAEKMNERNYKILYEQNRLLLEVGKNITANLNKENIFNVIAEEIKNFIKYDNIQIILYDEKIDKYRIQLIIDEDSIIDFKNTIIDENTFINYSIKNRQDLLINDVSKEYYKYIDDYPKYLKSIKKNEYKYKCKRYSQSLLIIPMIIKDKVIGTIGVQSYEKNAYDLKDLVTLKTLATYIGVALDNSLLYNKVQYNANYDSLTDIYNRRKVIEKINELRINLDKKEENYYIAIIDLDNFKSINDIYGHVIGDRVLVEVAKVIKENISENDIFGRYGGEEFILIVNNKDYINMIENIRKKIENINIKDLKKNNIKVTASIGVEKLYIDNKTLEENISLADKKLYKAKNTGKNKVIV